MRSLRKNQQSLYYSLYSAQNTIYEQDENGEIIYDEVDGENIPRILSEQAGYGDPVPFDACIAPSGGEAEAKAYGLDVSAYEATITMTDKSLPIDELSLIWETSKPVTGSDGTVDGDSADYRVVAVRPTLNTVRYFLKKL